MIVIVVAIVVVMMLMVVMVVSMVMMPICPIWRGKCRRWVRRRRCSCHHAGASVVVVDP